MKKGTTLVILAGCLTACSVVHKEQRLIPRTTKSYFEGHSIESVCPGEPSKQVWQANTAIMNPPVPETAAAMIHQFGPPISMSERPAHPNEKSNTDKIVMLKYPDWSVEYLNGELLLSFRSHSKNISVAKTIKLGSHLQDVFATLGDKSNHSGLYVRKDALKYCLVGEDTLCELKVSQNDCLIIQIKDNRVSQIHWEKDVF